MTTESTTAEAFAPPAASGCCASPSPEAVTRPSTCCGTAAEAKAENSCCGAAAKDQAVASGAGCCG